MATVAYLRVSTEDQGLDQQRLAILDYAQQHRITVQEFIATHRSAKHASQRADLLQMIEALHPGDRLIVSELSRLGHSLSHILQIIDRLIQKEVRLVAIKEAIRFEGKHTLQTKAMIALFGLFAEVERDLIVQRAKEGVAGSKGTREAAWTAEGALSTSKLDGKAGDMQSLRHKHVSKASIAWIMDVSPTTLHHFIKTRDLGVLKTPERGRRRQVEGRQPCN